MSPSPSTYISINCRLIMGSDNSALKRLNQSQKKYKHVLNKRASYILLCHRGAIGDFIFTWPAIFSLRKAYPEIKFVWIGKPDILKLGQKKGIVDQYFDCESAIFIDFFNGNKIPDSLININFWTAVFWMKKDEKIEKLLNNIFAGTSLFIDPFPENPQKHVAKYYFDSIRNKFNLSDLKNLWEAIPDFGYNRNSKTALIHPGSGSPKKNMPVEFFKTRIDLLRKKYDHKIKIIAGPAEIERNLINDFLSEEIICPATLSALDDIILEASLFVGNDSGVTHLAAINGLDSFAFYKSTDPAIWGTFGEKSINLRF